MESSSVHNMDLNDSDFKKKLIFTSLTERNNETIQKLPIWS
jgi:hypothetical protein